MNNAAPVRSARVFVTASPADVSFDSDRFDFSDAASFGELVYLMPAYVIEEYQAVVDHLRRELTLFRPSDFLLLAGNPVLIGCAVAFATRNLKESAQLQLLKWSKYYRRYKVVRVRV